MYLIRAKFEVDIGHENPKWIVATHNQPDWVQPPYT